MGDAAIREPCELAAASPAVDEIKTRKSRRRGVDQAKHSLIDE
jgi:hypothetical protein